MRLKELRFGSNSKAGDRLRFNSRVYVDSAGVFEIGLPEFLHPIANTMIKSYSVSYHHRRKTNEVTIAGKTLKECQSFIDDVIQEYLKCDVKEEKVIIYSSDVHACYYRMPDGSVSQKDPEDQGTWQGSSSRSYFTQHYYVGIAVGVYLKKIYVRGDKTECKYEAFRDRENEDCLENNLNDFNAMGLQNPGENKDISEMPYSDKAAQFFYDMVMGMCKLADKMRIFFGDEKLLLEAIQKKTLLLPK
jgi:hypothetical protein